jgi:hypothetical protein
VMSQHAVPETSYAIQAGFDEVLIERGVGHCQQISVQY